MLGNVHIKAIKAYLLCSQFVNRVFQCLEAQGWAATASSDNVCSI